MLTCLNIWFFVSDRHRLVYRAIFFLQCNILHIVQSSHWSLLKWNKYVLNLDLFFASEKWCYQRVLVWWGFFLPWDNALALLQCSCWCMAGYCTTKHMIDSGFQERRYGAYSKSYVEMQILSTIQLSFYNLFHSYFTPKYFFVCLESDAFKNPFYKLQNEELVIFPVVAIVH